MATFLCPQGGRCIEVQLYIWQTWNFSDSYEQSFSFLVQFQRAK